MDDNMTWTTRHWWGRSHRPVYSTAPRLRGAPTLPSGRGVGILLVVFAYQMRAALTFEWAQGEAAGP
jgi:hypothetical protein